MNLKIGRVNIPVISILTAVPKAVRAAKASASDNKDASSPGGEKVTAAEVAEAVLAFTTALASEVSGDVMKANGL